MVVERGGVCRQVINGGEQTPSHLSLSLATVLRYYQLPNPPRFPLHSRLQLRRTQQNPPLH